MNIWNKKTGADKYFSLTCFGITIHGNTISEDEEHIYIHNYDELSATLPKKNNKIEEVN